MQAEPQSPATRGLLSAAWQGSATAVFVRLGLGSVNINGRDNLGRTALHLAAMRGHTEVARLLLERGAEAECADNDGWTPLRWAVANRCHELAELLRAHLEPRPQPAGSPYAASTFAVSV